MAMNRKRMLDHFEAEIAPGCDNGKELLRKYFDICLMTMADPDADVAQHLFQSWWSEHLIDCGQCYDAFREFNITPN